MLQKVENRWNKKIFYEDQSMEWTTHHMRELIIGMGDINRHIGRNIDGSQGVHSGLSFGEIKSGGNDAVRIF